MTEIQFFGEKEKSSRTTVEPAVLPPDVKGI